MPNEDALAKLTAMLERHISVTDDRAKDMSARMQARDNADSEFRGEMRGALKTMQGQVSDLVAWRGTMDRDFPLVQAQARKAHDSLVSINETVDDVQKAVHLMDKKQTPLIEALARAESEKEARRIAAEENRARESEAQKKVEKKREDRQKLLSIGVPVFVTIITVVGGVVTTWITTRAHDDTAAKLGALTKQIEQRPSVYVPEMGYFPVGSASAPPAPTPSPTVAAPAAHRP